MILQLLAVVFFGFVFFLRPRELFFDPASRVPKGIAAPPRKDCFFFFFFFGCRLSRNEGIDKKTKTVKKIIKKKF